MWTVTFLCCIFLGWSVCSTSDHNNFLSKIYGRHSGATHNDNARKLAKRSAAGLDLHYPNGSTIGYYYNRNLSSKIEGNKTVWFVLDWPDGPMVINYEHPMNVYNHVEQLSELKEGVPAFVRSEEGRWYKITDPPLEFRRFLAEKVLCYLSNDIPKLGPEDFKPAKVEYYEEKWGKTRLFAPEDIEWFKKQNVTEVIRGVH